MSFELMDKEGRYTEILELAEKDETSIESKYWKLRSLYHLGSFDDALQYGESVREYFEEPKWKVKFLDVKGQLLLVKGKDIDNAKMVLEDALNLSDEIGDMWEKAEILRNIGICSALLKNGEEVKYYNQSLEISKKIGDKIGEAKNLNNLGVVARSSGELNKSIQLTEQALSIYEQVSDVRAIIASQANLGLLHMMKGDFTKSLEHNLIACEMAENSGNKYAMADTHLFIANLYHELNDNDLAENHYKKSLMLIEQNGIPLKLANIYSDLCEFYVDIKQRDAAKDYLDKLETLEKQHSLDLIHLSRIISQAVYLKSSNRITDKVQAQNLFNQLARTENINPHILQCSLINLVDLLITEYKSYNQDEVMEEIQEHLSKLHELGRGQHIVPWIIDALILKAKLAVVMGSYDAASEFIKTAEISAKNNGLPKYIDVVENEKKNMQDLIFQLKQSVKRSSFAELVDRTAILNYIQKAQKQISQT